MKLCRFQTGPEARARVGLVAVEKSSPPEVLDLSAAGIESLPFLLESPCLETLLTGFAQSSLPRHPWTSVRLLAPVDRQEVWAAGVTYLRSKEARQEESNFSAQAYGKVYDAPRPELFFKSLGEKVSGPDGPVGIRADARWSVPEPELALVFNSRGELAGCTLGNDMSSRDIEGENLLYLPQAKIFTHSCSLGPVIAAGCGEAVIKTWNVTLEIWRQGQPMFQGGTSFNRIKRSFGELGEYLFRSQKFPHGAVLLTGTGIVPPGQFTLQAGDQIKIQCPAIGMLENQVVTV
jgi:2-dehydro-3-deoxy-D-arabinonate dehydratase